MKSLLSKILLSMILIPDLTNIFYYNLLIPISCYRWKRHVPESAEQLCARLHVLLLHDGRHGTRVRQVPVVEEIYDRAADRKYTTH